MPIIYIKSDIFKAFDEGKVNVIAHGVNCSNGFGSGFAAQVAEKYPIVKKAYHTKYFSEGWGLGQIQIILIAHRNGNIVNCATQKLYGRDPRSQPDKMYCSYEAIRECMVELYEYVKENDLTIAIPKIGAGLAGGNWNEIEEIINKVFINRTIFVYIQE